MVGEGRDKREGGGHTVDFPVLLLGVLLEVCGEEYVLGFDPLQVLGHLVCRAQEVDVLVHDMRGVLILLAAGEGIDRLPFLGVT